MPKASDSLQSRLRIVRVTAGYNDIIEFSKLLKILPGDYEKYEGKQSVFSEPIPPMVLLRFIVITRVNPLFLLESQIPMFIEDNGE